ncbi:MAG: hypothetical protein JW908_13180 [Anaerolineales bacterium]|nr:hypothetical protein [Anaerolineales bacterium]
MPQSRWNKPRVFIDADVLMAGVTSSTDFAASLILLRLGEIKLIEAICTEQTVMEVQQTLKEKLPEAVKSYKTLVKHSMIVTPDPSPNELEGCRNLAAEFYIPIMTAALREQCTWLATFNEQQFTPGHPDILIARPDELVSRLRGQFAWMGD